MSAIDAALIGTEKPERRVGKMRRRPGFAFMLGLLDQAQMLSSAYFGMEMEPGMRKAFLRSLTVLLGPSCKNQKSFEALALTTDYMKNKAFSQAEILRCILRVAANKDFIADGVPIPLWEGERTSSIVQITGMNRARETKKGKPPRISFLVHFLYLTGLPAGMGTTGIWSPEKCDYILKKRTGAFGRMESPDPMELSGMFLKVVASSEELDVSDNTPELVKRKNKALKALREAEERPPVCTTTTKPCYSCDKTRTQCPLACRKI